MTLPGPLRSSSDDELELAVLRSARGDAPPDGARARVALALGVSATLVASSVAASGVAAGAGAAVTGAGSAGAGAAGGGTVAAGAAAAGAGAAATSGAIGAGATAGAGALVGSALAAWAGIGVAAGMVTSVAGYALTRQSAGEERPAERAAVIASATPARSRGVARRQPDPLGTALSPSPELPRPEPAIAPSASDSAVVQAAPGPAVAAPAPGPAVAAPAPEAAGTSAPAPRASAKVAGSEVAAGPSLLAQEVRALDDARQLLERGNPSGALAALEGYRTRFPHGTLATEAAVLRVKARLLSGDRAGAEREAEIILRQAPESRYAERVRALLGRGAEE